MQKVRESGALLKERYMFGYLNENKRVSKEPGGCFVCEVGGEPQKVSFINRVKKVNLLPYIYSTADVLSIHLKCRP